MSDPELREKADRRFEEVLAKTGARDPRDFFRQRLRELRERDTDAYRRAVAYFEQRLIPSVAAEETDALGEWLEYGRFLAELVSAGRTVQIDASGRAHDYAPPVPPDHLVLHLPTSTRGAVQVVGIPARLSPAQRATYDLLVGGRRE
jgi:hypothetical protein